MSLIGVYIGSGSVAVCALSQRDGRWIVRGSSRVAGRSAAAIREAFDAAGIKDTKVAVAGVDRGVVIRRIQLPLMSDAELAEAIDWEAEQYFPYAVDDAMFGYQRLADGDSTMEVLLFGNLRAVAERWLSVVREAGLEPVRWLPAALCAPGWYEIAGRPADDRVLVAIDEDLSHVTRFRDGQLLACRATGEGSDRIADALRARGLGESPPERTPGPYRGVDQTPIIRAVVAESAEIIAAEVSRVVDFFAATEGPVTGIDFTSASPWLGELESAIAEASGRLTDVWDQTLGLGPGWASPLGLACGRYPGRSLVSPRRGFFDRLFD